MGRAGALYVDGNLRLARLGDAFSTIRIRHAWQPRGFRRPSTSSGTKSRSDLAHLSGGLPSLSSSSCGRTRTGNPSATDGRLGPRCSRLGGHAIYSRRGWRSPNARRRLYGNAGCCSRLDAHTQGPSVARRARRVDAAAASPSNGSIRGTIRGAIDGEPPTSCRRYDLR